jgi:urease accessory protein
MLELIEITGTQGVADDTLTLPYECRQKSRQRVRLDSGRDAVLLLPGSARLADGDRLRASDGTLVGVRAATEELSTVRSDDALSLARACYHLGNRHVSLQIGAGWLRFQHDHVLDDMVRGLGLSVALEEACFEPERGAYHGHGHSHSHGDGHRSGHGHAENPTPDEGQRP